MTPLSPAVAEDIPEAATAISYSARAHASGATGKRKDIHAYLTANRPAIGRLLHGDFEIRSLSEAEKLATMLGSHCPNSEFAAIGVWELLSNAIEHGNLEIDFVKKSALLLAGTYQTELERRGTMEPYADRIVRVTFRQLKTKVRLRVVDQGKGFDFRAYGPDFNAAEAPNGRGMAIARQMSFSTLTYIGSGNIVEATILR